MSIITCHWAVVGKMNSALNDYHVEFTDKNLSAEYNKSLLGQIENPDAKKVDWKKHIAMFSVFKNDPLTAVTGYGTWHLNSDPRNGQANIEIASLTMGGSNVQVQGPWGDNPHTISHSLMHAYLVAIVCKLKNINPLDSFSASVEPSVLQNGPIFVVSTHGERAIQTNDDGQDSIPSLGYFAYSGDSNCRWDLAALDPTKASDLSTKDGAVKSCKASAAWIRKVASELLKNNLVVDLCGLDK